MNKQIIDDSYDRENLEADEYYDEEYDEEAELIERELQQEKSNKERTFLKELLSTSIYLLVVMLVTLLIVKFVGQRTVVQGESMMPTLHNQDNLIIDKISYRFHEPERFDIIVFPFQYEKNTYYIKRIIGLPGEQINIDEFGNIYINDEILEENYGAEIILDPGILSYSSITLSDDEYFVLGDNRNHSSDSRNPAVGSIKREDIIGRAWLRVYPFADWGVVE